MTNWCTNLIELQGDEKDIKTFRDAICSKDNIVDFNKLIPIPEDFKSSKHSIFNIIIGGCKSKSYVKLGLLLAMKEYNKSAEDTIYYIEQKYGVDYKTDSDFHIILKLSYNKLIKELVNDSGLNSNNIDDIMKSLYDDLSKTYSTNYDIYEPLDNYIVDKYGLNRKDNIENRALYYLILLIKYHAISERDYAYINWGTGGNASDAVWINNNTLAFYTVNSTPYGIFEKMAELNKDIKLTFYSVSDVDMQPYILVKDFNSTVFSTREIKQENIKNTLEHIFKTIDPDTTLDWMDEI